MATAEARYFREKHGLPVVFSNRKRVFWSEVFENNPWIVKEPKDGDRLVVVENYPGKRPYVDRIEYINGYYKIHYKASFRAEPGELYLSERERDSGIWGAVIVEPHVKEDYFKNNKKWPWRRWEELTKLDLPWVQLGRDKPVLPGVRVVRTETIRDALPYIRKASLVVTTDGAVHHAAAAFGVPAVVLWGGLASPENLGYDFHTNIWHGAEPCGTGAACEHCVEAMHSITVEEVKEAVEERTRNMAPRPRGAPDPVLKEAG